jgi:acetylornithine deacetylase/succinyl-diaminopimelate desuccinylase-like protein
MLQADIAIIADGGIEQADQPLITYAMRGIVAFEVRISGPKIDLHSGMYGGTVHNPAQVIAEMVAKLHKDDGSVAVPGFYDDVEELDDNERTELNKAGLPREDWDQHVGAPTPWGEAGYSLVEQIGARPTLEINGISGGYAGIGSKTVIPAQAKAKITCRLVAHQNPDAIYQLVTSYIHQIAPATVRVEFEYHGSGKPVRLPIDSPYVQALVRAFRLHWDKEVQYKRTGGTIPVVAMLQDKLGIGGVPFGLSLKDAQIHGPNENFHVDLFYKGIDTLMRFLEEIAAG